MNFRPIPMYIREYFLEEMVSYRIEIKPNSVSRLTIYFNENAIPERIQSDLLWIWGYLKTRYNPATYDISLDRRLEIENETRALKKDTTAAVWRLWDYGRGFSDLFNTETIESITIKYAGRKGNKHEDMVLEDEDFIRFLREAVMHYQEHTKDTIEPYFREKAHKANEINYNNQKVYSRKEIDLETKKADASKIYWFLRTELSSTVSDRSIFRIGAWLMFDAGARFLNAYKGTPTTSEEYNKTRLSETFGSWADIRDENKPKVNPYRSSNDFEDYLNRY